MAFGGKVKFNLNNLTPVYYGGLRDKWFGNKTAFGLFSIYGSKDILNFDDETFLHEAHHLWHSRAMGDFYWLNYGLQGISALIMGGSFIDLFNYYEQIAYSRKWF